MIEAGRTAVLVADGRKAKLYMEPRRGAELESVWAEEIGAEDRFELQDRPPRSFDRVGGHRHAMDGNFDPHEEEERRFLTRMAARVAAAEKDFDGLVVMAAPRALGVLREALPAAVRAKATQELAKDVLSETAEELRQRLRDLRIP